MKGTRDLFNSLRDFVIAGPFYTEDIQVTAGYTEKHEMEMQRASIGCNDIGNTVSLPRLFQNAKAIFCMKAEQKTIV